MHNQVQDRETELHEDVAQEGRNPINEPAPPADGSAAKVIDPDERWRQDTRSVHGSGAQEQGGAPNPRQSNVQG